MISFIFVLVLCIACVNASNWNYDDFEEWNVISPTCEGERQSPIDISTSHTTSVSVASSNKLLFNYQVNSLQMIKTNTSIDNILNNGHTIQLNYAPGSTLTVGKKPYNLSQFHFHTPSEHKLDGKAFDMEMHLVHSHADGSLAVVGVFMEVSKGPNGETLDSTSTYGENPFLAALDWQNQPTSSTADKRPPVDDLNVIDALPFNLGYYTYPGSLTTPPCSEIVTWYVLKTPITISPAQKKVFFDNFQLNARPVQPLNHREILSTFETPFSSVKTIALNTFIGVVAAVGGSLVLFAVYFFISRGRVVAKVDIEMGNK